MLTCGIGSCKERAEGKTQKFSITLTASEVVRAECGSFAQKRFALAAVSWINAGSMQLRCKNRTAFGAV